VAAAAAVADGLFALRSSSTSVVAIAAAVASACYGPTVKPVEAKPMEDET